VSNKSKLKVGIQEAKQSQGNTQLIAHHQEEMVIHSGPIPAPIVIEGYEKILPGAADRIIKMAELEQLHQHSYVNRVQRNSFIVTLVGQVFGILIGLSGITGGVFLVYYDKKITGFSVFFTSLSALVGIFIYQKTRNKGDPKK